MTSLTAEIRKRPLASYSLDLTATQIFFVFVAILALVSPVYKLAPHLFFGMRGAMFGMATFLVVPLGVTLVVRKLVRGGRIGWLEKTDLPLDKTAYLDMLNTRISQGRLAVIVESSKDGTTTTYSPGFSLAAVTVTGLFPTHNGKVHAWFRDYAERSLRPVAADIKTIRVELQGA